MTIHVFFCFPETKGRTLEEMEEIFNAGHHYTAWRLDRNVGRKTLSDVLGDEKGHEKLDSKVSRSETPPDAASVKAAV